MRFRHAALVLAAALATVSVQSTPLASRRADPPQPSVEARGKPVLTIDALRFKDANGNGQLDPYEDWRRPVEARVADLVARMTLEEKAGLMLIDTLNAGCGGALTPAATTYVEAQKMTRFVLRSVVKAEGERCDAAAPAGCRGVAVSPREMAEFTNAVQALAERQRLGIPVVFKDNARNHYETDPRFGISAGAGAFTEFPKEAGIAAAVLGSGSLAPVAALTEVMGAEWRAVGLRGMYGYTADLATEPRWYRVHETFTEDADLGARIMRALVDGLQGGPVSPSTSVALTIKHFPGGGPQEMGLDPHYSFGKRQVYPGGRFADHMKPFVAAIDAGVSAVMPYYGVPVKVTYEGVTFEETGFAFSRPIVTDLLRGRLGFKGYVNSDTGIINDRAWGLERRTIPERVAAAVNGGTDVLSGFSTNADDPRSREDGPRHARPRRRGGDAPAHRTVPPRPVREPVRRCRARGGHDRQRRAPGPRTRGPEAVDRPAAEHRRSAGRARLPLVAGAKVYTIGMGKADVERYGYMVTDGNAVAGTPRPSAAGHDVAVIRVQVRNANTSAYRSQGSRDGRQPAAAEPAHRQAVGGRGSLRAGPGRERELQRRRPHGRRTRRGAALRRRAAVGSEQPLVHDDGGVGIVADHAFPRRRPGGDA